ncbi:hypothetical protein SAMN05216365_11144 [Porphyromonadaceae bacterium NLAE-zl-C104]|nr:hypothetical protein SAMN05216331_1346 [Porphyromonadaceae bacterium KH3R12]SFS58787.1 hypothetical protein SAMN05216365_11144 [Porphyromonadaceae bacterium NLAE-zl-C104]
MKIITTREIVRETKTYFELAEKERIAVKRGRKYVNLIVTDDPDTKFVSKEYGSFEKWLDHHHPKTKDKWVKLFKKTLLFIGDEIVNELLFNARERPRVPQCLRLVSDERYREGALPGHKSSKPLMAHLSRSPGYAIFRQG